MNAEREETSKKVFRTLQSKGKCFIWNISILGWPVEPQVENQEALENVCTVSFSFPLPKLCSLRMVTLGYPS